MDGYLARRFAWTSKLGAYLDPIADKLLLMSSYAALGFQGAIPVWLMWVVLGRDALILAMVAIALLFTGVRRFPPTRWGKLSTIGQVFTALVVIVDHAYVSADYRLLEAFLVRATALLTVGSGIHYLWLALSRFPGRAASLSSEIAQLFRLTRVNCNRNGAFESYAAEPDPG